MYEIRAAMPPWGDTVDLLIMERQYRRNQNDPRRIVTALIVSDVAIHDFVEPCLRLDRDMAQQLMDNLWQCGLRPSEGSGSAGALAATQKHLEDMRALVFETAPPKKDESK
jgi:hypothetical protein